MIIDFFSIRKDWYNSNSLLPGLVKQVIYGKKENLFVNFPYQWIPLFELFGISWKSPIEPHRYIPFFSDLSLDDLLGGYRNFEKARYVEDSG